MTFMLLENDVGPGLSKAVSRSMQSVDKFLNYVHSDGHVKKDLLIGGMLQENVSIILFC